jgi:hypothetical protein
MSNSNNFTHSKDKLPSTNKYVRAVRGDFNAITGIENNTTNRNSVPNENFVSVVNSLNETTRGLKNNTNNTNNGPVIAPRPQNIAFQKNQEKAKEKAAEMQKKFNEKTRLQPLKSEELSYTNRLLMGITTNRNNFKKSQEEARKKGAKSYKNWLNKQQTTTQKLKNTQNTIKNAENEIQASYNKNNSNTRRNIQRKKWLNFTRTRSNQPNLKSNNSKPINRNKTLKQTRITGFKNSRGKEPQYIHVSWESPGSSSLPLIFNRSGNQVTKNTKGRPQTTSGDSVETLQKFSSKSKLLVRPPMNETSQATFLFKLIDDDKFVSEGHRIRGNNYILPDDVVQLPYPDLSDERLSGLESSFIKPYINEKTGSQFKISTSHTFKNFYMGSDLTISYDADIYINTQNGKLFVYYLNTPMLPGFEPNTQNPNRYREYIIPTPPTPQFGNHMKGVYI